MNFQSLYNLDRQIVIIVNSLPHNIFTDSFFLFFSIIGIFGILWFVLALILVIFDGLDNRKEMIALILAVLTDVLIVEEVLKKIFMRVRPEAAIGRNMILLLKASESYSFPSGHATIAFAAAYILSRQRKKYSIYFYILAFFVALSRIYLGKHYPSDVFAGGIIGVFIGYFAYFLAGKIFPLFYTGEKTKK